MIAKVKDQIKARELRKLGLSIKQIARSLYVAKSSVSVWVRDIELTEFQKLKLKQREIEGGIRGNISNHQIWLNCNQFKDHPKKKQLSRPCENFFDKWTPEMAYVLGYFSADGSMYRNKRGSCYISFTSTDIELIQLIEKVINVSNKIEIYNSKKVKWKPRYTLQIGSHKIYQRLLLLGFTPNKSLTLRFPPIPNVYLRHFVRGFFDGDGTASFVFRFRKNRKNKRYPYFTLQFTSGSYTFLKELQNRLSETLNLTKGCFYFHSRSYRLTYSTRNVVKLFLFMYNEPGLPYLRRKYIILKKGYDYLGP